VIAALTAIDPPRRAGRYGLGKWDGTLGGFINPLADFASLLVSEPVKRTVLLLIFDSVHHRLVDMARANRLTVIVRIGQEKPGLFEEVQRFVIP
jgi:hypothetical protein